jgi:hypothetical protein
MYHYPKAVQAKKPTNAPSQTFFGDHSDATPFFAPRKNNTGLPDHLKSGVEQLSGFSMDDVNVHYNSSKPAQLQAYAYAHGNDIHVGPGQEQHLPHEAWHVAQQKQGRVRPTVQMKAGVPVNDDQGLEREADMMGAKALQMKPAFTAANPVLPSGNADVIQRKVGFEFQTRLPVKTKEGEELNYQNKIFTTYPKGVPKDFKQSNFELSADLDNQKSVVEIVTPPADSKPEMERMMGKVDLLRSALWDETSAGTKETTIEKVVDNYKAETKDEDQYNIQKEGVVIGQEGGKWGELMFTKGQFTFGAKLEHLSDLLVQIMSNEKLVPPHDQIAYLIDEIKKTTKDINKRKELFEDSTNAETGLAALTTLYKKNLESYDVTLNYPKSGTLFMARTDFHSMYQQLDEGAKLHWDKFVNRQENKTDEMFPKGFYLDSDKDEIDKGPKYGDWLDSIKSPTDHELDFVDYGESLKEIITIIQEGCPGDDLREQRINDAESEDDKDRARKTIKMLLEQKMPPNSELKLLFKILHIKFTQGDYKRIIKPLERKHKKDLMSRGKVSNTASSMGSMDVPTDGSEKDMAIIENRIMAQPLNKYNGPDEAVGLDGTEKWKPIVLDMYNELQFLMKSSKYLSGL